MRLTDTFILLMLSKMNYIIMCIWVQLLCDSIPVGIMKFPKNNNVISFSSYAMPPLSVCHYVTRTSGVWVQYKQKQINETSPQCGIWNYLL